MDVTKLYDAVGSHMTAWLEATDTAAKMLAALAGIPFQMVVPLQVQQVARAAQADDVYWPSPPEGLPERGIVLES